MIIQSCTRKHTNNQNFLKPSLHTSIMAAALCFALLVAATSSALTDGTEYRSHRHGRNLRPDTSRKLQTSSECRTFAACGGTDGLVDALKSAAVSGQPLKICASATPISCRTTKNSGPSSVAFTSESNPISASMECVSDDLGATGGRCILDLSPGDGLDPLAAAYTAILLDKPGNVLDMSGFELRGIRGRSRVAMVKNGAEIVFRECVFTE